MEFSKKYLEVNFFSTNIPLRFQITPVDDECFVLTSKRIAQAFCKTLQNWVKRCSSITEFEYETMVVKRQNNRIRKKLESFTKLESELFGFNDMMSSSICKLNNEIESSPLFSQNYSDQKPPTIEISKFNGGDHKNLLTLQNDALYLSLESHINSNNLYVSNGNGMVLEFS